MNPFDLSGRVALITGSSKGIGRSIAENMAQAGAKVVISSRNEENCAQVAEGIRESGGIAISIAANVRKKEDLQNLVDETRKQLGPIDILVCNAAANPYYGPLENITDDAYHKTLDTNVLSILWLCRMVKEDLVQSQSGRVIIISSIGAVKATPNLGAYAISKAADVQMVKTLAVEWGADRICVNAILPGLVKTDFARALWDNPETEKRIAAQFPLGRLGEPNDIGPAAVFLASQASSWMTGQTIVIDGGSLLAN